MPLNYFCIHRLSGQIKVTQDFAFKDGDEFDLKIRVTDSDQWGKTENMVAFKFISRDECKDVRVLYKEAVRFCTGVSPANGQMSCPGAKCLKPLYKWREAVNASEKFRVDCAFDPDNMEAVIQRFSSCIGKSRGYLQCPVHTNKLNAFNFFVAYTVRTLQLNKVKPVQLRYLNTLVRNVSSLDDWKT